MTYLNDTLNEVCASDKTEHLNLSAFIMTAGKNELKTSMKHMSYECK